MHKILKAIIDWKQSYFLDNVVNRRNLDSSNIVECRNRVRSNTEELETKYILPLKTKIQKMREEILNVAAGKPATFEGLEKGKRVALTDWDRSQYLIKHEEDLARAMDNQEKVQSCEDGNGFKLAMLNSVLTSRIIYDIDEELVEMLYMAKWHPDITADMLKIPKGETITLYTNQKVFLCTPTKQEFVNGSITMKIISGDEGGYPDADRVLVMASTERMIPLALIPLRPEQSIIDLFKEFEKRIPTLSEQLREDLLMDEILPDIHLAVNTLLYLLGEPDIITTIHPGLKSKKKNRNKNPLLSLDSTVHLVGSRIGAAIRIMDRSREINTSPNNTNLESTLNKVIKPHIRSAHFHKYYRGVGRKEVVIHLLAMVVVNGKDINLDDILKQEDLTKVRSTYK